MKLGDVKVERDPTLGNLAYETKRLEARKAIKVARKQLTAEFKGWDKMLSKYESKVGKGEFLTHAGRTLIESSSRLSQETANTNLTLILSAIDQLMQICGNCDDGQDLDNWLDELLVEKETQMDMIAEGVDLLGDQTEKMRLEPEKKAEASGGASPGGEQGPSYRNFTYRSLDHM